MRAVKPFFAFILLLPFAAVSLLAAQPSRTETDDVREIVIRALFKDASAVKDGTRVYFLSDEEWRKDLPDQFMSRFATQNPPVRKVSLSKEEGGRVFDKQTGEKGIIFCVYKFQWKSETEVQVVGSVYRAGLNGFAETYTLAKKEGKWKITNKKLDTIS